MIDTGIIEQPIAPKTTTQEDLTTAGQRRINIIWEVTQAIIAVAITFAIIITSLKKIDSATITNRFLFLTY